MDKSEYLAIRELAWDILIDVKANILPIKITPIITNKGDGSTPSPL